MNRQGLTTEQDPRPNNESAPAEADSPEIAIQDRLVILMFLIFGGLFAVILLVDLVFGFFR